MRIVIFKIDDQAWMQNAYNMTNEQTTHIFDNVKPFRVIYTIIGEKTNADRYTLTDYEGNKLNINDMNGYQKGAILNDCMAYFCGTKPQNEDISGVIELQDMEKITEHTYGSSAFMRLKLNGVEYEITTFFREEGESYKTSADGTENREKVIDAFRHLY